MQTKIFTLLVSLAALLTGCDKENTGQTVPGQGMTTFSVTISDAPETRAAVTDLTRYVMEVYEGEVASGPPAEHIEQSGNSFSLHLDKNKAYTMLFWADYGTPVSSGAADNNDYNASDLKAVVIKTGTNPSKAAWSGKTSVASGDNAGTKSITLPHAVAQVNYKQLASEAFVEASNTLTITFPATYSLNVADRTATELRSSGAAIPVTHTFSITSTTQKDLGTSYVIARGDATDNKTIMDITAVFQAGTSAAEPSRTISNIPMRYNFRTNITGAYSNIHNLTITVECDDEWESPDYNETFPI